MSSETTVPIRAINTLLDTLSRLGFCSFDAPLELVWVRNMMKYQGRGEKNVKSAAHHVIEDLHKSPLIKEFCDYYPSVKSIVQRLSPDTLSDTVSSARTPDSRFLIPDQDPEQEQEQEREKPLSFGESGFAVMTEGEHEKLVAKLNGYADEFIQQFDQWVASAPNAKHAGVRRKDRHAYPSILNWYNRALKEGKVKKPNMPGKRMPDKPDPVC